MADNSANNGIFFVPRHHLAELMRSGRKTLEVYNLQAFTQEEISAYFNDDDLRDKHMVRVRITECEED